MDINGGFNGALMLFSGALMLFNGVPFHLLAEIEYQVLPTAV